MNNKDEGRGYFERGLINQVRDKSFFACFRRPEWMTDAQWEQAEAYTGGLAVPTDSEVADSFRNCLEHDNRGRNWAYSNVAAFLVGPQNYDWWCELIHEYCGDPDMQIDEGI